MPKIITDLDLQTQCFHELSVGNIPAIIFPKILGKRECNDLATKILSSKEISVGPGSTEKIGESVTHTFQINLNISKSQNHQMMC